MKTIKVKGTYLDESSLDFDCFVYLNVDMVEKIRVDRVISVSIGGRWYTLKTSEDEFFSFLDDDDCGLLDCTI